MMVMTARMMIIIIKVAMTMMVTINKTMVGTLSPFP